MKRVLIAVAALVVVLAALDRVGAAVAGNVVADELQRQEAFDDERPEVTVRGVPFLTQALRGRYEHIDIEGGEVTSSGTTVEDVDVTLRGVRLPLSALLTEPPTTLPVERLEVSLLVPFDAMTRTTELGQLTVVAEGDAVRVQAEVRLFDEDFQVSAKSRLTVEEGEVVARAESFAYEEEEVDGAVGDALRDRFDRTIDLGDLPWDLAPEAVRVRPGGVELELAADDTELTPLPE